MIFYQKSSIKDLKMALKDGSVTSIDLVKEAFELIEKNKEYNIFISTRKEEAIEEAKIADEKIKKGEDLKLLGIPIAIKENIAIKGGKVTAASKILQNHTAVYDANCVKRLKEEGAIIIGLTNLDEFAMGSSTETSFYGVTKNPIDKTKVSGGSSGGSAAAVSLGIVPVAIGSDTGGSIRQPATFCRCVGLKPTYGEVSRFGLYALASSLDVIGPITRNIEDSETVFSIIKGKDENDHTTIEREEKINNEVKNVAVLDLEGIEVNVEIKKAFEEVIDKLKEKGITVETVKLKSLDKAPSAYYITQPAEASSNLARYDGIRYGFNTEGDSVKEQYTNTRSEGFGEEASRRILLGTFVLSSGYYDAYYEKSVDARVAFKKEFDEIFEKFDVVISPTSPTLPININSKLSPTELYSNDIFTIPASLVGLPAISIPIGEDEKLGIGIQVIAPKLHTKQLFRIGNIIESIYGR